MTYEQDQEYARQWLIKNDSEAAEYWRSQPDTTDFIRAKLENLRDFGPVEIDED